MSYNYIVTCIPQLEMILVAKKIVMPAKAGIQAVSRQESPRSQAK
jgi:hypothetical protein